MSSILTAEDVGEIRRGLAGAATIAHFAEEFGVHRETIADAAYGRTRRRVTDPAGAEKYVRPGRRQCDCQHPFLSSSTSPRASHRR